MHLNKAILAVSIVIAAIGIFFAFTQFDDSGLGGRISLPIDFDRPTPTSSTNDRGSVNDDAFRVGQVTTVEASDSELSLPDLFEKVEKSVVQITDSSETNALDSRLGSGFVYDNNGHIITNNHVVNGGGRLDVTFLDGTVYRASLLGSDPFTDLAVLYVQDVPADKLVPLPLADSAKIRVGEQVAAIGNPFGLSGSMSAGIVSGLGRLIPSQEAGSFSIPDVIQTDAPINPGNSGGPLLNMRGEVIGINSAIFSTTGQFAGVGFAIPANTMAKVVPSLITSGSFTHPWLGVSGTDMTPGIAQALGLDEPRGFLVVDVVAGSPADKAGIQGGDQETTVDGRPIQLGGDVIVSMDGKQVRKIDDILVYLQREKNAGDELKLTVLRDGNLKEITATLAARPSLQESP
ncbi:MAG TPA: trypsin-like peptidase domain-containing protein [Nitrososphaera sp.]|nr:trypsin-like peptidase domain-containing protein [Nitrososphaera sp.]